MTPSLIEWFERYIPMTHKESVLVTDVLDFVLRTPRLENHFAPTKIKAIRDLHRRLCAMDQDED